MCSCSDFSLTIKREERNIKWNKTREKKNTQKKKKRERDRKRKRDTLNGNFEDRLTLCTLKHISRSTASVKRINGKRSTITWIYLYFTTIYFNLANALKEKETNNENIMIYKPSWWHLNIYICIHMYIRRCIYVRGHIYICTMYTRLHVRIYMRAASEWTVLLRFYQRRLKLSPSSNSIQTKTSI